MADAPAPSGGGGWGALEILVGIVLIIGAISTLTGTPLSPSKTSGSRSSAKAVTHAGQYSLNGCMLQLSSPKSKQVISNSVTVSGSISGTFGGCTAVLPGNSALYAQVVDSTGTTLSALAPITISRSIFGDLSFNTAVPLSGIARSTSAQVIITAPSTAGSPGLVIRVPVILSTTYNPAIANPVYTGPATSQGQPFASPTTNGNPTFFANPPSQQYNAPQQYNQPAQQNNPQPNPPAQNSGGNGTTF